MQRLKFKAWDQKRIKCPAHLLHFQTYMTCTSDNRQVSQSENILHVTLIKADAGRLSRNTEGTSRDFREGWSMDGRGTSLTGAMLLRDCRAVSQLTCHHEYSGITQVITWAKCPLPADEQRLLFHLCVTLTYSQLCLRWLPSEPCTCYQS